MPSVLPTIMMYASTLCARTVVAVAFVLNLLAAKELDARSSFDPINNRKAMMEVVCLSTILWTRLLPDTVVHMNRNILISTDYFRHHPHLLKPLLLMASNYATRADKIEDFLDHNHTQKSFRFAIDERYLKHAEIMDNDKVIYQLSDKVHEFANRIQLSKLYFFEISRFAGIGQESDDTFLINLMTKVSILPLYISST